MVKLLSVPLSVTCFLLAGCAGGNKSPLKPQSFYAQQQQRQASGGGNEAPRASRVQAPNTTSPVSPPAPATPLASTAPATRPVITAPSADSFIILGTVVAEANGQPVYADKILARIEQALAANARRLDPQQYRFAAARLIDQAINEQVTDELEFAAAQRNTSEEDRQMAKAYTAMWRQREITKAGGSEAVARARSLQEGMDFDERVDQQYRRHLVQIYYFKHVWPRVQVSADDIRRFYDQNINNHFSEKSAVRFRIIRVDLKQRGKEQAWETATDALNKARSDWDFAKIAANPKWNDDAGRRANGGYWEVIERTDASGRTLKECAWMERGTLAAEALEEAIFALEPGQVSDIIETRDALYIARLEEKRTGRVRPFEDLEVQAKIRDQMEREQRFALRVKEQKKLIDAAVHRRDDKNVELTIDMAMQRYHEWRRPTESAQAR